jgi:HTH-type transcriptional regulator / antitoxin HigA
MTQTIGNKTLGFKKNRSYLELLNLFPPRIIKTEEDYLATQKVIDSLIDQDELNQDERDYLNLLGTLIAEYEAQYDLLPELTGIELIKALLIEMNLTEDDLISLLGCQEKVKQILNQERQLTNQEKAILADFFQISVDYF